MSETSGETCREQERCEECVVEVDASTHETHKTHKTHKTCKAQHRTSNKQGDRERERAGR